MELDKLVNSYEQQPTKDVMQNVTESDKPRYEGLCKLDERTFPGGTSIKYWM